MAALNIRNLDETVKRRLQVRAARHGRSMDAEVREILAEAVRSPPIPPGCSRRSSTSSARSAGPTSSCPSATSPRGPRTSPNDRPRHERGVRADAGRARARRRELGPRTGSARAAYDHYHLAEVRYGIARLPDGRRKQLLLTAADDIFAAFADQLLPVDIAAAEHYAAIASSRARAGKPIAGFGRADRGVCRSRGAALATRNVADFEGTGIEIIDPWLETSS